jgi:hypothetical protein
MAFTERYASVAGAGAHDGTSEANAWTMAEAITSGTTAGTRVNFKAGSYSQGAATIPSGTVSAQIAWRGYNSAIGDLDTLGRSSDGTINVTNFPVLTITGTLVLGNFQVLQNFDVTGALSSTLLGGAANDNWSVIRCKITNTQNNASARCLTGDNGCSLIGSDLYCSGAAHASVFDTDQIALIEDCRFRGTSTSALVTADWVTVLRSLFWGNASSVGVTIQVANASGPALIHSNTFYGIGTGLTFPDLTPVAVHQFTNNHVTDCSKWIDNLHSATAAVSIVEKYTRIRDVTTPRTGIESISIGEITTDTGGAATDYKDAGNGNFYLIPGAPGRSTGTGGVDIGAYQHAELGRAASQLGVI